MAKVEDAIKASDKITVEIVRGKGPTLRKKGHVYGADPVEEKVGQAVVYVDRKGDAFHAIVTGIWGTIGSRAVMNMVRVLPGSNEQWKKTSHETEVLHESAAAAIKEKLAEKLKDTDEEPPKLPFWK